MNVATLPPCPRRRRAFTLLETLLAMAILVTLLTLTVSAARSFNEGLHLARAGQIVVDQVGAARQLASAHGWTVYVYLYKLPAAPSAGYGALQLWRAALPADGPSAAMMLPVDRAEWLPSAVVISEDATRNSPLLGLLATSASQPPPLANLPPALAGASYVAFAIRPSGTLALDDVSPGPAGVAPSAAARLAACCLTLVPARAGGQAATPANFVTVQINTNTGVPVVYRP